MINFLTFIRLVVAVFCATLLTGAWVVVCIALIVSIMMQIDNSLID